MGNGKQEINGKKKKNRRRADRNAREIISNVSQDTANETPIGKGGTKGTGKAAGSEDNIVCKSCGAVFKSKNKLAIMGRAAKNGPTSSRSNETATMRYLRRAVAIERRAEGDLTGHHFWSNCPRTVAF